MECFDLLQLHDIALVSPGPCVYAIRNSSRETVYVGFTRDVHKRIRQHRRALTAGLGRSRRDLDGWEVIVFEGNAADERAMIEELQPRFNKNHTDCERFVTWCIEIHGPDVR